MTKVSKAPDTDDINRGEVKFAKRFRRSEEGKFLYAHGVGWHQWDGCRWAECLIEEPGRAVEELLDEARWEIPQLMREGDNDSAKHLMQDLLKLESRSGIEGVLAIARKGSPIGIAGKDLNPNPVMLNTQNGTLNLESGEVSEPDPGDHITKVTRAPFVIDAKSDEWDQFIERILPNEEDRQFVQRVLGYALLGEVREHVLPIFTGPGANGKGTLRDAVMWALGDYSIEVSPDILLESRSDRHTTELMDLQGSRLVFASETDQGRKFAEATMKRLVGGDPIRARRMHKDSVQFYPSHTMVMLTNKLPEVSGDDPAVWRRILVVPFSVVIPEKERDGSLPEKLKKEGPAVLAWIHEGWLDYLGKGLAPPKSVLDRTAAYKSSSDVIGRFIEEECVVTPAASVQARPLFRRYEQWCLATGERPMAEKVFGPAVESRQGLSKGKSVGVNVYRGIGLMHVENDQSSNVRPLAG